MNKSQVQNSQTCQQFHERETNPMLETSSPAPNTNTRDEIARFHSESHSYDRYSRDGWPLRE